ncbi:MAG TPA: hypothetical protein VM941_05355, partial [Pyrinomonadaceae bacterium]|nr:hypothetical protein [Pyrinomonadaceae bacterium]
MLKRLAVVALLTLTLTLGFAPRRQAVFSSVLTDSEIAVMNATATTDDAQPKQDDGNRFVKVLTAPFKAIGRLFGRGGNKNDNKLHRLSEKDVKKFESSRMTKIVDARTAPAPTTAAADP